MEKFSSSEFAPNILYTESQQSKMQVDFILEKLGLRPNARILDLCCGMGRHLLELTRRGYNVLGVDASNYMLDECRKAAELENLQVGLLQSDMREIDCDCDFDAVINMFTSFGYLESDEEDLKVLKMIAKALRPGGKFLLDVTNREYIMRNYKMKEWNESSSGTLLLTERKFDLVTGRNIERQIIIKPDGTRSEQKQNVRLYTYTEIKKMLESVGLRVNSAFGDFDSSDYSMTSQRMIIISQKNR